MTDSAITYSKKEERLNILTHGFGFVLSLIALPLMVVSASMKGNVWQIVSAAIYGSSLVVLYLASTLFHGSNQPITRNRLKVFDHASIYILIAGSYTPFLLVTLRGTWGWSLFGVVWGLSIAGVILKLFFTGKYKVLSTIGYVLLGWVIVVAIRPLVNNLDVTGLWWLVAGGFFYSFGAILYLFKNLPYNHAIFHIFVLSGSICQFVTVFWYVLP